MEPGFGSRFPCAHQCHFVPLKCSECEGGSEGGRGRVRGGCDGSSLQHGPFTWGRLSSGEGSLEVCEHKVHSEADQTQCGSSVTPNSMTDSSGLPFPPEGVFVAIITFPQIWGLKNTMKK